MDSAATSAFQNYTRDRVNLLAQQISGALLRTPLLATKKHGAGDSLSSLVTRKINGTTRNATSSANLFRAGTLGAALMDSIPKSTDSTATITLEEMSQDQAIASARVAVINGMNIVKNGYFGTKKG